VASYVVVSWKGIPAVVEARDEADAVTRQLTERFQALIDAVAMQLGLADSEAYLDAWERSAPEERPGSATDVADAVAQDLEDRFFEFAQRAFTRA
jgi:cvfA/B/C family virulence factor